MALIVKPRGQAIFWMQDIEQKSPTKPLTERAFCGIETQTTNKHTFNIELNCDGSNGGQEQEQSKGGCSRSSVSKVLLEEVTLKQTLR